MRKVAKKSVTKEYIYEADDGQKYAYEGLAIEHDINIVEKKLETLKRGNVNINDLNLTGSIYKIRTTKDLDIIKHYCELKNFSLNDIVIPTNIIITDNFVLSTEELKKVVDEINSL